MSRSWRCCARRIDPGSFQTAFTGWVRGNWPERPDLVAIDGKTPDRVCGRRSPDLGICRGSGREAVKPPSGKCRTRQVEATDGPKPASRPCRLPGDTAPPLT